MKPVLIACLTAFGLIAVAPVYTASSKREPPIADGGDYVGNTYSRPPMVATMWGIPSRPPMVAISLRTAERDDFPVPCEAGRRS